MKAKLETVQTTAGTSFKVTPYAHPFFEAPLHLHPEYELILFEAGEGIGYVGDAKMAFRPGDVLLIGAGLPHLWLSAPKHYAPKAPMSRSVYAQFPRSIFPADMASIPEIAGIGEMLHRASRGLVFRGDNLENLRKLFRKMPSLQGLGRWLTLYSLLYRLDKECESEELASEAYQNEDEPEADRVIYGVHTYLDSNYQKQIVLEDIAAEVGMNASALCRYYKRRTGQRIFEYLARLRISYAQKLLASQRLNISQVAYDCGFNSISHFNHQFKQYVGQTPTSYLAEFAKLGA